MCAVTLMPMDSYSESTERPLKSIRITERHENTHPIDELGQMCRVACWMLADRLHLADFASRWIPIANLLSYSPRQRARARPRVMPLIDSYSDVVSHHCRFVYTARCPAAGWPGVSIRQIGGRSADVLSLDVAVVSCDWLPDASVMIAGIDARL